MLQIVYSSISSFLTRTVGKNQRTIGGLLMIHETAFEQPASLGQLKEIVAALVQSVPAELSHIDAQRFIENKGWLIGEIQALYIFRKCLLDQWVQLYHEAFHREVNVAALKLPKWRPGFTRLIVVAQGL